MKSRKAFTLVELMIVVLILGALAAIAIPRITEGAKTAKINACKTNIDLLNSQIELYNANNSTWPTMEQITSATYFPDGAPECPFATAYTIDATTHRIKASEHTHN